MGEGPSFEQIDAAIKAYFQRALNWSLESTDVLMDDPILDREYEAADMPEKIKAYKRQIASGQFSQDVLSDAQELLAPLLPAGDKSDVGALRHASRGVLRARMEQTRRLIADLTGDYAASENSDPLFAGMSATDYPPLDGDAAQAQIETLQSIAIRYRAFKEVRGDAAKTLADFDVTMRLACEVMSPEKPINAVGDADVRALRDLIAAVPPNSGKAKANEGKTLRQLAAENKEGPKLEFPTQEKRLRFFRGMLNWACDEGHIDKVPGAKVAVSAKKNTAQTGGPYSNDDLELIFSTPVYAGRASAARSSTKGDKIIKDGKFWVPLIGLFSGMRLGEIVQLQSSDLRQIDGVSTFADYDELNVAITDILGRLRFGVKAEPFEAALNELATALGFAGERPDREWKEGPDNLWALDDRSYLVIEAKSEVDVTRAEVNKREAEQMNRSAAWFDKHYKGMLATRLIIHPAKKIESAAAFTHDVQGITEYDLRKLEKACRGFFKSFEGQNLRSLSSGNIQTLLNSHNLRIEDIQTRYSRRLKNVSRP